MMGGSYSKEVREAISNLIDLNKSLKQQINIQNEEIHQLKKRIKKIERLYENKRSCDIVSLTKY